ncbi:hypothetical protein BCV70DRAFT_201818 [Testicularia cyperi]|uniref:ER-bound oxygenase mpaB/mpaB'/Rubber oxygenase catalytic domain-containing protein n=1 Tax=Testicularia cyperi TaxID=1882483 RepID=A0A317XKZ8_9BASI|nr:hypothetical protein BCV70DRAFT_201818 [Testicularia cyperi]
MASLWVYAGILLAVQLARVYRVRFAKLRYIQQRYGGRYALTPEEHKATGKPRMIDSYRGVRDAQRIVRLAASWDTPFIFTKALEVALFRTYGIPTISSLLMHTGQLSRAENASRRYVDTSGLIQAFMTYPVPRCGLAGDDVPPPPSDWETNREDPNDPRSSIALARVNFLHGRWGKKISNDDLLYTLSVFFIEPPKWIDAYEWRKTSELEKEAIFSLYYHIGRCMGITNIPDSRADFIEWSVRYEEDQMVYTKTNQEVAQHTVNLLLYSLPRFAHGFARNLIASIMDERLRAAMGFPAAPSWVVHFKNIFFASRAVFVRYMMMPRSKPLSAMALGCDGDSDSEFNIEKLLSDGIPSVCPASGARASDGRTCPVGGHTAAAEKPKTSPWRMELKWYENDPVYARPYKKGSLAWMFEELRVQTGLLKREDRRGAQKWRASTLPSDPKEPVQGLGGFRLEELGPTGLETKGRKEVFENAEKLHGRPLEGIWAFEP